MRQLRNVSMAGLILPAIGMLTGCQSANNAQAEPVAAHVPLPDFSPERATQEAAAFESYKSKPDFTQIDVVAIVPAADQ